MRRVLGTRRAVGLCALSAIAMLVALGACTRGQSITEPTSVSTGSRPPSRASLTPLTPSFPFPFSSNETTTCGSYLVSATTRSGTVPLLSCAGLAGLNPLPSVTALVGDEVTITGLAKSGSLSASPASLVEFHGTSLLLVRAGSTVITAHGGLFCSPVPNHGRPTSCDLLQIIAS